MQIFAGQQIVVHSHEGASDYLLVTFNQLDMHQGSTARYFLQAQVEQADISCIGVMTTEDGFYLSPEMDEVVRIVRAARRNRTVIVFGQSMGGYAALKYSAALQADHVIALSPYYSVDPDELELKDERHRRVLAHSMAHHGVVQRPAFKGMGVKPHDVSGRLLVMFDPAQPIDVYGAGLIAKHLPGVTPVRLWHAGHVIYDALWEASIISGLLAAVLSDQPDAVEHEMIRLRRTHVRFMLRSLFKAAYRKPRLCGRAIRSARVAQHADALQMIGHPINLRLVYLLSAQGKRTEAAQHFDFMNRTLLGMGHDAEDIGEAMPIQAMQDGARCLLLSCHGSFLAYDTVRRQARFEPHVFGRDQLFPVVVRIERGVAMFSILSDGMELPVPLTPHDVVASPADPAVELVPDNVHRLVLRAGDNVLSAARDGALHLNPSISGDEQRFVALVMPSRSSVLKASTLNWFDRSVLSVPTAGAVRGPVGEPPRVGFSMRKLLGKPARPQMQRHG